MSNYITKLFRTVYTPAETVYYTVIEYTCTQICTTTYDIVYTPPVTGVLPPSDSLAIGGYTGTNLLPSDVIVYSTTTCIPSCGDRVVTKSYTIPAYTEVVNDIGWTAGAHSNTVLNHGSIFKFTPSADAVGIVTGITTSAHNVGYSYQDIDYGFYFSKGLFRIIEATVFKDGFVSFVYGDIFGVRYLSDRIEYIKNDVIISTTMVNIYEPLIADISLYASGDTVEDACISLTQYLSAIAQGSSSMSASMNRNNAIEMSANAIGGSAVSATAALTKFISASATGTANVSASINLNNLKTLIASTTGGARFTAHTDGSVLKMSTSLNQLGSTSSGGLGNYCESQASLSALETLSEAGLLMPELTIANASILGLVTAMNVFQIEALSLDNSLEPLDVMASEGPYAEAIASLEPLGSFGGEFPVYDGVFVGAVPTFSIEATATSQDPNGTYANIPAIILSAETGAQVRAGVPSFNIISSVDVANVARTDGLVPSFSIEAFAYTGMNARAAITVPKFSVEFTAGATLEEKIPGFSLYGEGLTGSVLNSEIIIPGFSIEAQVTIEEYGIADIEVPGFLSLSGILKASFGNYNILASASTATTPSLSTQVMNTTNLAITEYDSFEFDNIIQVDTYYYGVKLDGLYKLTGSLDATSPIAASFETTASNFNNAQRKNVQYVYITARADSKFSMQSSYDEKYSTVYNSENIRKSDPVNWKVKMGKGLKAIYWGSYISNVDGSDFQIQSLNEYTHTSSRRR